MQLTPATTLDDVYKTVSPEPLLTPSELEAFYRDDLNRVRGGDKVESMALGLHRSSGGAFYKAFLMGHPGVGKSTEMTRLVRRVVEKFRALRFSVTADLDPGSFKPFDVLLLMMFRIVEETKKPVGQGGASQSPKDERLQNVLDWFAKETSTIERGQETKFEASTSVGPPPTSLWARFLGLSASVRGEIKYASDRKTEVVEYRLNRISALIKLLNELLDDCNNLLRAATGREWLFVGEDFDKPGIPIKLTEDLFLSHANIFKDLRTHLIFNIPIGLVYSEKAPQLPFPSDRIHPIPDTPVFHRDHVTEHKEGRAALRSILGARVSPKLFEGTQMKRLIVASGGNLRDLFALVGLAADNAILRGSKNGKVNRTDADRSISSLRTEYERRLGESPYDAAKVTYPQKAQRLVAIYQQHQDAKVPDPVLYSLLNARAVQEFDRDRWFGVHPLVVDILKAQGRIPPGEGRADDDGTE
jgi:hypothetical protein